MHHELTHIVIPAHDKEGKIICVDFVIQHSQRVSTVYISTEDIAGEEHEGKYLHAYMLIQIFYQTFCFLICSNLLHSGGFCICDYCERRFKSEELLTKHRQGKYNVTIVN